MNTVLDRICADKRQHIESRRAGTPLSALEARANEASPPRGFAAQLQAKTARGEYGLIAELKKASPSKGLIRADFNPTELARAYAAGGAACLSVLTDTPYFQGQDEFLTAARGVVDLPVLRKDFMLEPYQVVEARALGADCILLIMAALSDAEAGELEAAAGDWGMDVLIEVHDAAELARALRLKSRLIGINNRNLKTLDVDLKISEKLASALPTEVLGVCESGLGGPSDLERMSRAGLNCFLIGESLMRRGDVKMATEDLLQRRRETATQ